MKKGYKKLFIFQIIMLSFIVINSFFNTFLTNYSMCVFFLIELFIFKRLLGFEKDKHRYIKDIILDTVIFLAIFFLIYYILGIFIGFASTNNYGLNTLINTIIPLIISIILKELLRYFMLCKSELNKKLTVLTILIFIFLDITTYFQYFDFSNNYNIFKFIAMILIPSISKNISYSYITYKCGYKPVIFYALIMNLYSQIIPIEPNVSEYVYSLISIFMPIIFTYRVYNFLEKDEDKNIEERLQRKTHLLVLIPIYAVVIFIICIYSGYFRYWSIVIASGSMMPKIAVGDLVIIDKKYNKNDLVKGQVIAYKNNNTIIVHRIYEVFELENTMYYITKGDANAEKDNLLLDEDMIVGTVNIKIPYAGLPTVWIHNILK